MCSKGWSQPLKRCANDYYGGEKVRAHYAAAAPDLESAEDHEAFKLLTLEPLVRMKLTSFRDKDRTHLRDLIEVGLVHRNWLNCCSPNWLHDFRNYSTI